MAINKNFVVKNGLEVGTDLIFANDSNNTIGIGTTNVKHTLHVKGGIGATDLVVTGIATISSLTLPGSVAVGTTNFTGLSGQYLKSTGTGVEWEDFPVGRISTSIVATPGQTVFNLAYSVGLVDIFINGVKLTSSEFVATDGVSITLNVACFGGENVEILAYAVQGLGIGATGITGLTIQDEGILIGNPQGVTSINFVGAAITAAASGAGLTITVSGTGGGSGDTYWSSTSAGIHTLSNVGVGTTNPRFALEVGAVGASGTSLYVNGDARITGILSIGTSSITLNGDTNTLTVPNLVVTNNTTGVIASGVAVTIRDGGGDLGNASIIDFGDNLSVTLSAGIATITGSASGSSSQWVSTAAGIHTLSNVGIGTTNPTSKFTVKGNTSLETLSVSGVSTFSGNIRTNGSNIKLGDGNEGVGNQIKLGNGSGSLDSYGDSADLWIYHNASIGRNWIHDITASGVEVLTNEFKVKDSLNSNTGIIVNSALGTEIYYSNSKKFETLGAGVTVTGTTFTNQLNVSGVSTLGTVQISSGIVTATFGIVTYYGDTSNAADGRWTLGASGTSDYTFTGIGFTQTTNDPVLYLARGRVYEFVNNSGGSHPFEIRVSDGGAAYSDGVTNNAAATGVIRFEIPFNAPDTLYYQCTNHSGMGNTISVYPSTI